MRILSISGQNIASLADAFHIDFVAEPLCSAGLFAITGETGAGKSSILDAMCLALYGDAPRLTVGSAQDEVPDVAGEAIKAKDPRAILRRGAVTGWACVTFTGLDGADYAARWTARRARDRADGKLQAVSRALIRLSDGQVLASQVSAVTDQVQALTGLSYDEFRRTLLLAQGDFDAFLKADTNDRAALLEKVTGTELYRAISTRVYDRTEAARSAHAALQMRRDEHRLLDPTDLASLTDEREALSLQAEAGRATQARLTADLAGHARLTDAHARLAEAGQAADAAQRAQGEATAERARLSLIDQAEPLRLPWGAAQTAALALAQAQSTFIAADAARKAAEAAVADHRITANAAQADHIAQEAAFKAFGPVWTEATQLDAQISAATGEVDTSQAAAEAAALLAEQTRAQHISLTQSATEADAALASANQTLADLAPLAPLAQKWDQLQHDLAAHSQARQAEAAALAEVVAFKTTAAERLQDLATLSATEAEHHLARQSLRQGADEFATQIRAAEAQQPQTDVQHLNGLAAALDHLDRIRTDLIHAQAAGQAATVAKTAADADAGAADQAKAGADIALRAAEAAATALAAPLARANMALSEQAHDLRLRLEPGVPCPVCGATEHAIHTDTALADLAAALRADVTQAQEAASTARHARTQAEGAAAAAVARAALAATAMQTAAVQQEDARHAWQVGLATARALDRCPALPDDPQDAAPALAAARTATERARSAALALLDHLAALRAELTKLTEKITALSTQMEAAAATRRAVEEALAVARQGAALAQQAAESHAQRGKALCDTLVPLLAAAGEGVAALADADALQDRLQAKVTAYAHAYAAAQAATATLNTLAPRLAEAAGRAKEAAHRAAETATALTGRQASLTALCAKRAALLGGEATEQHRTRINAARIASQNAKEAASHALSAAEAQLASAEGQVRACLTAQTTASAQVEQAQITLATAMAEHAIQPDQLPGLLATPRAEAESLRQQLRHIDDAVTAALSAVQARRNDVEQAMAAGIPDATPDALMLELAALDATQGAHQERIGAINAQVAADTASRQALGGLEAQIAAAKADHDIWLAVNAAIGSRNGDRFARIAQSITLDLLVDRANHHLTDLKPRYRLKRAADLALQVEDRDMGGEARATRSLSGGERFLVSLALALALSRMGGKGGLAATLFIDEGFGSLDAESLDLAIDALETLQSQGCSVGVISHVDAMKDRIPTQIRVTRQGGGKSAVSVTGPRL